MMFFSILAVRIRTDFARFMHHMPMNLHNFIYYVNYLPFSTFELCWNHVFLPPNQNFHPIGGKIAVSHRSHYFRCVSLENVTMIFWFMNFFIEWENFFLFFNTHVSFFPLLYKMNESAKHREKCETFLNFFAGASPSAARSFIWEFAARFAISPLSK